MQDRDPAQGQSQLIARRQVEGRVHAQCFEIDVRLEEPIEQDEAVGAAFVEPARHVCHRGEVGSDLDGERDGDARADRLDEIEVALLDLRAGLVGIRRDEVHVQFQCVGTGILDHLRVPDPAAVADPVQRTDQGNLQLLP